MAVHVLYVVGTYCLDVIFTILVYSSLFNSRQIREQGHRPNFEYRFCPNKNDNLMSTALSTFEPNTARSLAIYWMAFVTLPDDRFWCWIMVSGGSDISPPSSSSSSGTPASSLPTLDTSGSLSTSSSVAVPGCYPRPRILFVSFRITN
jgi:hypothetical protein